MWRKKFQCLQRPSTTKNLVLLFFSYYLKNILLCTLMAHYKCLYVFFPTFVLIIWLPVGSHTDLYSIYKHIYHIVRKNYYPYTVEVFLIIIQLLSNFVYLQSSIKSQAIYVWHSNILHHIFENNTPVNCKENVKFYVSSVPYLKSTLKNDQNCVLLLSG